MQFLRLTHSTGSEIYINPELVRAVLPQGAKGSRLVFDANHEINIKDDAAKVLDQIQHAAHHR
jgi:hypothetical protein